MWTMAGLDGSARRWSDVGPCSPGTQCAQWQALGVGWRRRRRSERQRNGAYVLTHAHVRGEMMVGGRCNNGGCGAGKLLSTGRHGTFDGRNAMGPQQRRWSGMAKTVASMTCLEQ